MGSGSPCAYFSDKASHSAVNVFLDISSPATSNDKSGTEPAPCSCWLIQRMFISAAMACLWQSWRLRLRDRTTRKADRLPALCPSSPFVENRQQSNCHCTEDFGGRSAGRLVRALLRDLALSWGPGHMFWKKYWLSREVTDEKGIPRYWDVRVGRKALSIRSQRRTRVSENKALKKEKAWHVVGKQSTCLENGGPWDRGRVSRFIRGSHSILFLILMSLMRPSRVVGRRDTVFAV